MPEPPTPTVSGHAAAAISGHLDTRTAAMEVGDTLFDDLAGTCDLLMVFASFHHRAALPKAAEQLQQTLQPKVVLGVTSESVLGVDEEREGRAGLSALALRMPGVTFHPWRIATDEQLELDDVDQLKEHLGIRDDIRALLVLADPFTTPMHRLLPRLDRAVGSPQHVPIIGGMASGASQPGHNVLLVDGEATSHGAIGLSILGNIQVESIVSQGCRPIGEPLVVTAVKDNSITELGGQVPMSVLKSMTIDLAEADRTLMNKGLLIGVVINEYREHFGRGDFLVRHVTALDMKRGHITVAERLRVGQTIQFHVRDAATATEDLQLLLDAQQLDVPPLAALLFTCNGRGTRLFPEPHHDLGTLQQRLGSIPVAGFFAAGEIGPIADQSFVHGHTASVALFRSPSS